MTPASDTMSLRYSPLESARFGLRVFRADVGEVNAAALADALDRERVDVAIVRLPADAIGSLNALRDYGLAPIVADSIVRYDIDLPALRAADLDDAVTLRDATPADARLLESLAREIFAGYVTHYRANPLFPDSKILDGYGEWAAGHVRGERGGSAAWLVETGGEIAGFSCYRTEAAAGLAIGVLNGVLPAFRGRGVYRDMLRRMLHEFGARGLARFVIATQLHNVAVQRIWVAQGLALRGTYHTIHINAAAHRRASTSAGASAGYADE